MATSLAICSNVLKFVKSLARIVDERGQLQHVPDDPRQDRFRGHHAHATSDHVAEADWPLRQVEHGQGED